MVGIVLGSGFAGFADRFTIREAIPYHTFMEDLPPKVEGHARQIIVAEYQGQPFLIFSGKLHFYEGFSTDQLVTPFQYAMEDWELDKLVVTSASGGLQKDVVVGEWQEIHQVLPFPEIVPVPRPLERTMPPSLFRATSLPQRVYAYQQGPSLGTPAEYRALQRLGADLVGMSIHPERCVLRSTPLEAWYWSLPVVSYVPFDQYEEPSHEEVLAIAHKGVDQLVHYFLELFKPIL